MTKLTIATVPKQDLPLFPLRKASPYLFLSLSQKIREY